MYTTVTLRRRNGPFEEAIKDKESPHANARWIEDDPVNLRQVLSQASFWEKVGALVIAFMLLAPFCI